MVESRRVGYDDASAGDKDADRGGGGHIGQSGGSNLRPGYAVRRYEGGENIADTHQFDPVGCGDRSDPVDSGAGDTCGGPVNEIGAADTAAQCGLRGHGIARCSVADRHSNTVVGGRADLALHPCDHFTVASDGLRDEVHPVAGGGVADGSTADDPEQTGGGADGRAVITWSYRSHILCGPGWTYRLRTVVVHDGERGGGR